MSNLIKDIGKEVTEKRKNAKEAQSLRQAMHQKFLVTRKSAMAQGAISYPQTRTTKEILEAKPVERVEVRHFADVQVAKRKK